MLLHWSGDLQDTCNLVLLTKLVNCKLVTVKRGALGFLILQFWLFNFLEWVLGFCAKKLQFFWFWCSLCFALDFGFFFKLAFGFGLS